MLFNSIEFAIFLPIVFLLYWFATGKNRQVQNVLLLIASYVFYGWWDWRFLSLIVFSSGLDFIIGLRLGSEQNERKRKLLLWSSLAVNLGFLGFFKYYNFFAESFVDAFTLLGRPLDIDRLNIILPVGISFYTFQTLSYSIDVYRRQLEPTRDALSFFAFVSFFPQLVAGPIERASNLLPQFLKDRDFDYEKARDGMRQILWGLFKKVVIADNCADFVNLIFNNSDDYSGGTLILGAVFFAFQIYGDFSGYSDIAIGTARLFGFNLMQNFAFPYFSRDIAEFWRRWHISLSTWFRDYLYIPLGGSRGSTSSKVRNVFIIFLVSGFWHGANWTFIIWGGLNALYFLPLLITKRNRTHLETIAQGKPFPSFKELYMLLLTFSMTVFAWIFFRAESLSHALQYVRNICRLSLPRGADFIGTSIHPFSLIALLLFFISVEWLGRESKYGIENVSSIRSRSMRWAVYTILCFLTLVFHGDQQKFIYFQF